LKSVLKFISRKLTFLAEQAEKAGRGAAGEVVELDGSAHRICKVRRLANHFRG